MWKMNTSNELMFRKIYDNANNLISDSNEIIDDIRLRENDSLTSSDEKYRTLLELYAKIEHEEYIKEKINSSEKKINQYFDDNPLKIIKSLKLGNFNISNEIKMEEFDYVLYILDKRSKEIRKNDAFYNKRDFIFIYTLFENHLIDMIKLILHDLSKLESDKIHDRIHNLSKADLNKKITWFSQFDGGIDYDIDLMKVFIIKRNSIIHASSKYSKFA